MKKFKFIPYLAALFMLGLNSCMQCYDERFCQDMIGQDVNQAIAILGTPTQTEGAGSVTSYIWFTDASYTTSHIRPEEEKIWVDDRGVEHRTFRPAERVVDYHSRKAKLTLITQGGVITNYKTHSTGEMCNTFIPKQVIEQYIAADKAAKAAR